MAGRRDLLAPEAPQLGLLFFRGGGHLRRQPKEGRSAFVQKPIEHQAQGVDIRPGAIGLVVVNLRRHIFKGADFGAANRLFHRFGNAEIAQLIISVPGQEGIGRLDIPVEDVVPLAQEQGPAQILPHPVHLILIGHQIQSLGQGGQQLHLDVDFPAQS